jgi:hypothetical protein
LDQKRKHNLAVNNTTYISWLTQATFRGQQLDLHLVANNTACTYYSTTLSVPVRSPTCVCR